MKKRIKKFDDNLKSFKEELENVVKKFCNQEADMGAIVNVISKIFNEKVMEYTNKETRKKEEKRLRKKLKSESKKGIEFKRWTVHEYLGKIKDYMITENGLKDYEVFEKGKALDRLYKIGSYSTIKEFAYFGINDSRYTINENPSLVKFLHNVPILMGSSEWISEGAKDTISIDEITIKETIIDGAIKDRVFVGYKQDGKYNIIMDDLFLLNYMPRLN